jgi:hypothetical protein
MSWSAITILTARSMYAYILSRNAMGLMQSISELTRLGESQPNMLLFRDCARAYAALLGGHYLKALGLYEAVLSDPRHAWLPTHWINRTHYAEVLRGLGRYADAKRVCQGILADSQEYLLGDHRRDLPVQQLALAEAMLGELESAKARLDQCLAAACDDDSPMLVGGLHRDRAVIAMHELRLDDFDRHLQAMSQLFGRTRNPWLVRQCQQLSVEAQAQGLFVGVTLEPSGISQEDFETALSDGDDFNTVPAVPPCSTGIRAKSHGTVDS